MSLSEALIYIARSVGSEKEAWKVLRLSLRRGELGGMAETWGPRERWNAIRENRRSVPVPPEAWEYATLDTSRDSTVYWPSQWPVPGTVYYEDEDEYAHGVHLAREDVEGLWPDSQTKASDDAPESPQATRSPSPARVDKGGAPSKYDWERALIAVARRIHEEGLPDRASRKLQKFLTDWFSKRNEYPSEAEIRKRIRWIYEEFPSDAPE
jgi:hypothetical protein